MFSINAMIHTSNPKLYRELSAPFENTDAATKALEAFGKDLEEIRAKHKICDVVAVIQVNAIDKDGEEGLMTASMAFGDPMKKPLMLAQALGKEQQIFEGAIGRFLKRAA
jgi:hypothetical protein